MPVKNKNNKNAESNSITDDIEVISDMDTSYSNDDDSYIQIDDTNDSNNDSLNIDLELESQSDVDNNSTKPVEFLSNKKLYNELVKCKCTGQMSNELASMFNIMIVKFSSYRGRFIHYTYLQDMQSFAMLTLVKVWKTYDVDKKTSPFSYFTECIKNAFWQYINYERKQQKSKDAILVSYGMTPSYSYQEDSKNSSSYGTDQTSGSENQITVMCWDDDIPDNQQDGGY